MNYCGENIYAVFLVITLILLLILLYIYFVTNNIAVTVIALNKIYYSRADLSEESDKILVKRHCQLLEYYFYNPFFCYIFFKSSKILQEEMSQIFTAINNHYKLGLPKIFEEEKARLVNDIDSVTSLEAESL